MRRERRLLIAKMKYTSQHILEFLEKWAPQSTKLDFDNVGLLVGDSDQHIEKVIVSIDVTREVVEEAITNEAELIIAHHPLIFRKLSNVTTSDATGLLIYKLIKNDIGLIAAHTNLDAATGGVSYVMAERLNLRDLQFLKPVDTEESAGFGVIGTLSSPMKPVQFLQMIKENLNSCGIRYTGSPDSIKHVAVCGGAGAFLIEEAVQQGADAYVTADLKYHDFFTESPSFLLVDAGHYESEVPVIKALSSRLRDRFPEMEVLETGKNTNPVIYFDVTTQSEAT